MNGTGATMPASSVSGLEFLPLLLSFILPPWLTNFFFTSGGGICFCCILYTYFRVPEPTGRSFAELDMLFQKGISARKFHSTEVDVFNADVDGTLMDKYQKQQLGTAHHVEKTA